MAKLIDYAHPLVVNKMVGRMLVVPQIKPKGSKSSKQILLLYGNSGSLEQLFGLAEILSRVGTVTAPDLPGHGGMDSLFRAGLRPDLEGMASYLAAFIKLRYHAKKYVIVALWSSVPLVTFTLQRYPELQKNVELVVSLNGFARFDDIDIDSSTRLRLLLKSKLVFGRTDAVKTQLYNLRWLLTVDVCRTQLPLNLIHLDCTVDGLINTKVTEQHMAVAYRTCQSYYSTVNFRLLSRDGKEAKLPAALLRQLASQ